MTFSRAFVRLNWAILVVLYLVIFAGSFVRITGSGMGCPDWPKCFGQWVPPTDAKALPPDYRETFLEKRAIKATRFVKFLNSIGFKETAKQIENDPTLYQEEPFNVARTYTEYINRLLGAFAGLLMVFSFGWALIYYRKARWLIALSFINLILMGFQGWFGSIVVATNLVPWTITVHLLVALIIVLIHLYTISRVSPKMQVKLNLPKLQFWIWWGVFIITFYQMFLGTQVREYVDSLTKAGLGRESWNDYFGWAFFIHRSFSWLVLGFIFYLGYRNEKGEKQTMVRLVVITLILELVGGVLLAYADMPGWVQTCHLVFACILFGILGMGIFRYKVFK